MYSYVVAPEYTAILEERRATRVIYDAAGSFTFFKVTNFQRYFVDRAFRLLKADTL